MDFCFFDYLFKFILQLTTLLFTLYNYNLFVLLYQQFYDNLSAKIWRKFILSLHIIIFRKVIKNDREYIKKV